MLNGSGAAMVTPDERSRLLGSMRGAVYSPSDVCELVASTIEEIATRGEGVGSASAVTWLSVAGESMTQFFGLPEPHEFNPPQISARLQQLGLKIDGYVVGTSFVRGAETEIEHRKRLELSPGRADYWSNYGAFLQDRKDDLGGAQAAYERSLELDSCHAPAHGNLGSLHVRRGEYRHAIERFVRCLELDPGNVVHLLNLVRLLAHLGVSVDTLRELLNDGLMHRPGEMAFIEELARLPAPSP
jgi:hypothetical protein